jgi:hypothetical protein
MRFRSRCAAIQRVIQPAGSARRERSAIIAARARNCFSRAGLDEGNRGEHDARGARFGLENRGADQDAGDQMVPPIASADSQSRRQMSFMGWTV